MAFAELWLPIIGAGVCIAWAIGAWYGGSKYLATWLVFGGVTCLLLLATLQWQHAIEKAEKPSSEGTTEERVRLRAYLRIGDQRPSADRTTFIINVKNTGITPARELHGNLSTYWDKEKKDLPDDFTFPDIKNLTIGKSIVDLPAGSETDFTFPLEPESFQDAESGNRSFFVYGHFNYTDVFKTPQHCNFCYKILPMREGKGQMQIWHSHNDCS